MNDHRSRPTAPVPGRPGPAPSLAISVAATTLAMGLMFWARGAYQIRTLPERIMEWLLLFLPLDLFEKGLQTLGANAKDVALDGGIVGMAVALVALGYLTARASARVVVLVGFGLWLFAMGVVLPVTGGGFFATGLFQDVLLTNASYLGVALAYAAVLLLGRLIWQAGAARPAAVPGSGEVTAERTVARRSFVGTVAGAAVAYAATLWLGRSAGTSGSDLPLATVGSPAALPAASPATPTVATTATATPTAQPTTTAVPSPSAAVAATTSAVPATPTATTVPAAVTPPAQPTATAVPVPPGATPVASAAPTAPAIVIPPAPSPERQLTRNQDGVLAGAVPPPGDVSLLYTPNPTFYITTKNAAGDPVVDPAKWRLALDGEVVKPVQLDLRVLYQLPAFQLTKTLECISNFVVNCEQVPFGCNLISNATWKGARLSDVLDLAGGLKPGVQSIAIFSADEYTGSIPPDPQLLAQTYLVYEMNGAVLPLEHGYPARILTPGRYGMKSPKWVIGIRPMRSVFVDWFGQRGWSHDALVNTMTRIDVPTNGQTLPPGDHRVAGIAYAGTRGVSRVEFSADGGKSWRPASFLEEPTGLDQWVRWQGTFTVPSSGTVQLAARSTDRTGARQVEAYSPTQPNGATGLRTIEIKVGPA